MLNSVSDVSKNRAFVRKTIFESNVFGKFLVVKKDH